MFTYKQTFIQHVSLKSAVIIMPGYSHGLEKSFRFAVKSFGDGQSAVLVVKLILPKINKILRPSFSKGIFQSQSLTGRSQLN